MKKDYDVRRKSDGAKVYGPVYVHTAKQAVGYYVAHVLHKRYEQGKFYATAVKPQPSVIKIAGACPQCSYLDPQKDQASHCPNCD